MNTGVLTSTWCSFGGSNPPYFMRNSAAFMSPDMAFMLMAIMMRVWTSVFLPLKLWME